MYLTPRPPRCGCRSPLGDTTGVDLGQIAKLAIGGFLIMYVLSGITYNPKRDL